MEIFVTLYSRPMYRYMCTGFFSLAPRQNLIGRPKGNFHAKFGAFIRSVTVKSLSHLTTGDMSIVIVKDTRV